MKKTKNYTSGFLFCINLPWQSLALVDAVELVFKLSLQGIHEAWLELGWYVPTLQGRQPVSAM